MSEALAQEPPWREIVEKVWERVAAWETDYERDPHERAIHDLHDIITAYKEQWQDWSLQELRKALQELRKAKNE